MIRSWTAGLFLPAGIFGIRCGVLVGLMVFLSMAANGCGDERDHRGANGPSGTDRSSQAVTILNVSYDATRKFYDEFNVAFVRFWEDKTGEKLKVLQSHGGSGEQARAVIAGVEADVATLVMDYDIDMIQEERNLLAKDWKSRLPYNSSPYTSTVVFLVRRGNPGDIRDWNDLVREGVTALSPNPKTSGGARWNYLAAWGYAMETFEGDTARARDFVTRLYRNIPLLDVSARASALSFAVRGFGDVLIAWESEAFLILEEFAEENYQIVYPSISILAEPPVAVIDAVVDRRGTRKEAEAYLEYLFSPVGQRIAAENHFRPRLESVAVEYPFPSTRMKLLTIADICGDSYNAQMVHFADGGLFDRIYRTWR